MPQRRGLPVLWTDGSLHRQLFCAAKRLGSSVPPTSPCRSLSLVTLPGTLLWVHEVLPLSLLVDLGPDDSFIDSFIDDELARPAGLTPW